MMDDCRCGCFWVDFEEIEAFNICFEESDSFDVCFGQVTVIEHGYDPYAGPYEVIPKAWEDQILPTTGKNMLGDVTVYEVPYAEVSNPEGTTVVIAS